MWKDGAFVHAESLSVYAREEHEALLKDNWRSARLKKYAENLDGRRDKLRARLAEKRRLGGAKPRRKKLPNSVLRSDATNQKASSDKYLEANRQCQTLISRALVHNRAAPLVNITPFY